MSTPLINIDPRLSPLTQKDYLNRLVRSVAQPEYVWDKAASTQAENFPHRAGMPEVISVRGLMAPTLQPNNVANFSDPLEGMTVSNGVQYEQFLGSFDRYDKLLSVNMHGDDLPIVSAFEDNMIALAQWGASTSDFLARNALYNTYTGGNTFAAANANSGATSIKVDDIRGFVAPTGAVGEVPTANVVINGVSYPLTQVTADVTNASGLSFTDATGQLGVSGTLTIGSGLTSALAAGTAVVAQAAPFMLHANARASYSQIQSGDLLTAKMIRQAKGVLWGNRAPRIGGAYTLYADNYALQGLYQDPEFQSIFRGGYDSSVWQDGEITKLLGVRVVECTSNPLQILPNGQVVSRPMLVSEGALIKFNATERSIRTPAGPGPLHILHQDNIAFITRPSLGPAAQFITQSGITFVGYSARTDRLLTSAVVPTASNANYKRAVALVCAGA